MKKNRFLFWQPVMKGICLYWKVTAWSAPGGKRKWKCEKLLIRLSLRNWLCAALLLSLHPSPKSNCNKTGFPQKNWLISITNKLQVLAFFLSHIPQPDCFSFPLWKPLFAFVSVKTLNFILHRWLDRGVSVIKWDQRACWFIHLCQ